MTQTSTATDAPIINTWMLTPGETRIFAYGPFIVKLFSIAGGSFTRLDTRDAAGNLFIERSGNYMSEVKAVRAYGDVCRWILASSDRA